MKIKLMTSLLFLAFGFGSGCSDSDFASGGLTGGKDSKNSGDDDDHDDNDTEEGSTNGFDDDGGIILDGDFDADGGDQAQTFSFGGNSASQKADYLFVLDNSPSMVNTLNKLATGFASLTKDTFPKDAKIGVTYQMVAAGNNLNQYMDRGARDGAASDVEPGFLRLVSKDSITNYKATGGSKANKFPMPGCDEWFDPGATDSDGNDCLTAHTQISLRGGPCEAGSVSYHELVTKMGNTSLFRKGSVVNVVFVSDTQDPGCGGAKADTIKAKYKTFDEMKELTAANSPGMAGFTMHAIAPAKKCGISEGSVSGTRYYELADAKNGQKLDICNSNDYSGVITDIINTTSTELPIYALNEKATSILSVWVDGKKLEEGDYELEDGDILKLKIDPESYDNEVDVKVYYKTQQS
jgi:hypothetical protein